MMVIPLNDLNRRIAFLKEELRTAYELVLMKGRFILGHEVTSFEEEFAAYCGVQRAIGVGNGTDALELALRALEIGPGHRVVAVANAGGYSTTAINAVGAEPIYVDIDPHSMNMSCECLKQTLASQSVSAVVVTHLYGKLAEIELLLEIANAHHVPLVEDCAQAHGAARGGKRAGSWGRLAAFSFYPPKNLGALGDGGAVVTNDGNLAEIVKQLREYGWNQKYKVSRRGGLNSRLDEFQAAFLRIFLRHLDVWNNRRRQIVVQYNAGLSQSGLRLPKVVEEDHVCHLYVIRSDNRTRLRDCLREHEIGHEIHYPIPDHQQEISTNKSQQLPITEIASQEILTLPCFPELTDAEIGRVIDVVLRGQ
jgi:aminotransferase EvaB